MGVIPNYIINQPKLKTKKMNIINDNNDNSNNLVSVPDDINNMPLFSNDTVEREMTYLVVDDNLYFYTTQPQYDIIDIYIVFGTLLLIAYFVFRNIIFIDYKKS